MFLVYLEGLLHHFMSPELLLSTQSLSRVVFKKVVYSVLVAALSSIESSVSCDLQSYVLSSVLHILSKVELQFNEKLVSYKVLICSYC